MIGVDEGLPEPCVIQCDNIVTVPKVMLHQDAVGQLNVEKRAGLDRALRYALDIQF
jgi:mRNA interferase MazF